MPGRHNTAFLLNIAKPVIVQRMESRLVHELAFVCSLIIERGDSFSASLAKSWNGLDMLSCTLSTFGGGAASNACETSL